MTGALPSQPGSADASLTFSEWRTQFAQRVKLIAGVKTLAAALEMLPHNVSLIECWRAGENPNDAADNEMTDWDE